MKIFKQEEFKSTDSYDVVFRYNIIKDPELTLIFFIIGLILSFTSVTLPFHFLSGLSTFLLIFGGLISFISGLLHMST